MKKFMLFSLYFAICFGQNLDQNNTNGGGKSYQLNTIVIEATRNEVDAMKYPGSVGILESKNFSPQSNIIDSLTQIPGIASGVDRGRQIGNYFNIRGFGYQSENRVIIKQDGVARSANLYSNHISSFRSDSDILKRVEVVKGTSSILHGSGAIGGIVSMQTKDARDYLQGDKNLGAMLGGRFESNNMHSLRGAVYGKTDRFDVLLYGKKAKFGDIKMPKNDKNLDKNFNDENINTIFLKTGVNFLDSHEISFSIYDFSEKLNTVWQTLYHNGESKEDLSVKGKLTQRDYVLDYKFIPLNELMDLSLKLYKSNAKYDRGYSNDKGSGSYANEDERYGAQIKNISKFDTGAINHNLVVGFDFQNRREDSLFISDGKLNDPDSFPAIYKDYGLYFQNISQILSNLELTLGGRYDIFNRKVNLLGRENFDAKRFSPRVGLAYTMFDKLTFLAGYSQSFRAPTPHETSSKGPLNPHFWYIPNKDLKSETASEYEIGLSFDDKGIVLDDDNIKFKAMYFNGKIKDMISIEELPQLGNPPRKFHPRIQNVYAKYSNISNAKRNGYELEFNYKKDFVNLGASYEHLHIYDAKTDKVLTPFADKLMLNATFGVINNLNLGFDINHWFKPYQNPKILISRDKIYTKVDKSFTIANFKGNYKFDQFFDGINVNFGVNNIFDKQYINATQTNESGFIGVGRNFYVDFEMKF